MFRRSDGEMKLSHYERDKVGQKAFLITAKAEAVKKLGTMINEALLNDDDEAVKMYVDVIEQHLNSMLKILNEIKETLELSDKERMQNE